MGLDPVEIVMTIEETFKISIPDKDLEKCRTIGDLIDVVTTRVDPKQDDICRSRHSFYILRKALLEVLPLTPKDVRPSSFLEALIPQAQRQAVWQQLRDRGVDIPGLERSNATYWLAVTATIAPFLLLKVWLGSWWPALGIIPAAFVAAYLTRPLAVCAPSTFKTVGGAALHMTKREPDTKPFTRAEVCEEVRRIISDQLNLPIEELTNDLKWPDLERRCPPTDAKGPICCPASFSTTP
jgi:hypothetical protein